VVESILSQNHEQLELVICDNASTDETEQICRKLAAADDRVIYHRQSQNVGILRNFVHALELAKGEFFRWIGDDDSLSPNYVSRCLSEFGRDDRLVLVTTRQNYVSADGTIQPSPYVETTLSADDPIQRLNQYISFLIDGNPLDPLYALARRSALAAIPRRNMIREDEVFALKLALAGPWGHVQEILARRHRTAHSLSVLAERLGVPMWHAYVPTAVECKEIFHWISTRELTPSQRRRARIAVARLLAFRPYNTSIRRVRNLVGKLLMP